MSTAVRVRFALQRNEDGWPPAASEGLWAVQVAGDLYRLDNTPWFAFGVAADDLVEAQADADGVLWFVQVRERAGHVVVRVIPRDDGPLAGDLRAVVDLFDPLGVGAEGMSTPVNMVALDIRPDAPLALVKALLLSGEADGRWYYEEACISDEWRQLS